MYLLNEMDEIFLLVVGLITLESREFSHLSQISEYYENFAGIYGFKTYNNVTDDVLI